MSARPVVVSAEAVHFIVERDRAERAKMQTEIIALREQVRQLGGEPVSKTGEEWLKLYRAASKVVHAASMLTAELGTSAELLREFR